MSKLIRRTMLGVLAAVLFLALLIPGLACRASADENAQASEASAEEEISERLFTTITLSISGDNLGRGNIYATAKNEFTLFPSTVPVVVSLYSSSVASTDYRSMTLQASVSTEDLNMGETLTAIANTNSRQYYWYAVAEYKEGGSWKTVEVGPALYDARGYYIAT